MQATPERLRAALADLPVVIEAATSTTRMVAVPSYGGPRPSTVVTLAGAARAGRGEHVGWTNEEHAAFRDLVARVPHGGWRLGGWSRMLEETGAVPYDRAALEAAAIDLALDQRSTTLASLAGVVPRPIRQVVSFGRTADPGAEAARHPDVELKVDVDPAWPEGTWQALGAAGRVAVLDWKGTGDMAAYERALRWCPDAVHEDPAPPFPDAVRRRASLDRPITSAASLAQADPLYCNLKPARMGGVLEALAAAAACTERGIGVYLGGMFEIDVGRRQLRDLAAVLCPDGPNDLAPIPLAAGAGAP